MSTTSSLGPFQRRSMSLFGVREMEEKLDKTIKENFDLKLRIKFLDEMVYRGSPEGVRETIAENSSMRKKLSNAVEELRKHRAQVDSRIEDLTKENEELTKENEELNKEKEELNKENEELMSENKDLRRVRKDQKEELTSRYRERTSLRERIDELHLQMTLDEGFRRNAAKEEEAKIGELRDENSALRLENQDYAEQARCLLDQLEDADRIRVEFQELQESYATQALVLDDESHSLHETVIHVEDRWRSTIAQQESSQTEILFLQEEQEGLVIKIGQLEDFITNLENNLSIEKKRVKVLNTTLADERQQREVSETQKLESQKMVNDLNHAAATARENSTKLKRRLSCTELDAKSFKQQICDLEQQLKDLNVRLTDESQQREVGEFEKLESQKIIDGLNARLTDESQQREVGEIEKLESQKTIDDLNHAAATAREDAARLENRLSCIELEASSSKQQTVELEQQLKDLNARLADERQQREVSETQKLESQKIINDLNQAAASAKENSTGLKKRLSRSELQVNSSAQQISDLQQQRDVVRREAQKKVNDLNHEAAAAKENTMRLKKRLSCTELEVKSSKQQISNLQQQLKDRDVLLEQAQQLSATFMAVPELAKLRGENRLLKSELARVPRNADSSETSEQRWLHRLREMERRVKVEREARLLDRAGARRRLQDSEKVIDGLNAELERERSRGK